jgi:two-component system OmpR family response regulator
MSRILLVDDDTELTELLSDYLSAEGLEVSIEQDGQAGRDAALIRSIRCGGT